MGVGSHAPSPAERRGPATAGTLEPILAAMRVMRRHAAMLLATATAVTAPIGAAVLALDLHEWQAVDPGTAGAVERELGDTVRTVHGGRAVPVSVAQYALGALAYAAIAGLALRRLTAAPGGGAGGRRTAAVPLARGRRRRTAGAVPLARGRRRRTFAVLLACGRRRRTAGAVGAAVAAVAAVRLSLSVGGAAALAPLATSSASAYLAAIGAVHVVGKIVTAPFLAAVLVALYDEARPPETAAP